jgi:hypothetical protein
VYQILEVNDEWNILKCTVHSRRVQTIFIILAILEEFWVILVFHETKIPMVDIKVQVYFKFNKNKIWKKMKFPSSMRNGRFHPHKYRGKITPIFWNGSDLHPFSQNAKPILITQKKGEKNAKTTKKGGPAYSLLDFGPQPAGECWSLAGRVQKNSPSSCPHFFAHVVNSYWLAPAHACLA